VRRSGFTLIEILLALILIGVGMTSVVGLLLVAVQRSTMVTAFTTMGPQATSAANLCVMNNLVPTSGNYLDLGADDPAAALDFKSPYAIRIERATSAECPLAASDDAFLVTLKVRMFDTADHREREVRCLGTMFIRSYLRPRP
jgi:prepilin-type N-terminal cleavage/methylation domain-containing protein